MPAWWGAAIRVGGLVRVEGSLWPETHSLLARCGGVALQIEKISIFCGAIDGPLQTIMTVVAVLRRTGVVINGILRQWYGRCPADACWMEAVSQHLPPVVRG